jgi:hypothetical protein
MVLRYQTTPKHGYNYAVDAACVTLPAKVCGEKRRIFPACFPIRLTASIFYPQLLHVGGTGYFKTRSTQSLLLRLRDLIQKMESAACMYTGDRRGNSKQVVKVQLDILKQRRAHSQLQLRRGRPISGRVPISGRFFRLELPVCFSGVSGGS